MRRPENNTTRPVAFHVHGLFHTKTPEGSPYGALLVAIAVVAAT